MSQIEARILQQDYVLTCPEGQEEALLCAVQRVDLDMERIRNTGKVRARERVGVLTAVNLAFENALLLRRTEELEQALELALNHEMQEPVEPTPSEAAVDSVYEEAKVLAAELEALLTLRELELLQAQQLIARLEAALEVDSKLL